MRITSRLTGMEDLLQRFDALAAVAQKRTQTRVLKLAAAPMQQRMSELARRSDPDAGAPGHLADHIGVSGLRKVEGEPIGDTAAAVAVGPTSQYWNGELLEFGSIHAPAFPFARPAFDETVDACRQIYRTEMESALRRAAARGRL